MTPRGARRDPRAGQAPEVRLDRQRTGRADRGNGVGRRNTYDTSPLPRRNGRNVTSIGIGAGGVYFYYGPGRYGRSRGYQYPVYNRVRRGSGFSFQLGFDYEHPHGYGYAYRSGYGYGYWPYYPIYSYGTYVTTYDEYPDLGAVRLQVQPRHADVFVDGYFAGVVDDFDGLFQRLRIEAGPHQIEVDADGYEPLLLDVYVRPGETTRYEGYLRPLTFR